MAFLSGRLSPGKASLARLAFGHQVQEFLKEGPDSLDSRNAWDRGDSGVISL